jgi:hypothetical protein
MPTAVDKLNRDSSDAQIKAAISDCIATEIHAGREQSQAIAMCHSMARDKTGKELGKSKS